MKAPRDIGLVSRDPSTEASRRFIEAAASEMGVTARSDDYEVDWEIGKWAIGEWEDTGNPAIMGTFTKGFDLNQIVEDLENAAMAASMKVTVMSWEIIIR